MKKEILESVGLTSNESKIYIALLELGKVNINKIADKTGLHRRTIYDCLQRLEDKGLVGFSIENKTRYFNAVDPHKLLDFLREKEESIKDKEKKVENILPELFSLFQKAKSEVEVHVYKGKEGLKTVMEDIIREGKEWLSLTSAGKGPEILPYYLPRFHKRRIKEGIKLKVVESKGIKRGKELEQMAKTEVRYAPLKYLAPISIWMYGNKTAFMLWDAEVGILIENKETTESFKTHFNILWKSAK